MPELYQIPSDQEFTPELILSLIRRFEGNELTRFNLLRDYYNGRHSILYRKFTDPLKPNKKIINPYPNYVVEVMTGFFMGSPVKYSSENERYMTYIQDVLDANHDQAHNMRLARDMSIYGMAYELVYLNDKAEVKYSHVAPDTAFLIHDDSIEKNVLAGIRFYGTHDYLTEKKNMVVELYTKDERLVYVKGEDADSIELIESAPNRFREIPLLQYKNNDFMTGDFENVIPLIDGYDESISDTANDQAYFVDKYMVIKGMTATETQDVAKLKEDRILIVGENGDVDFLVAESDHSGLELHKNRLNDSIHKFCMIPDMSADKLGNELSGKAIQYKFTMTENLAITKERSFKESLQKRLQLITRVLNIRSGRGESSYDALDIALTFTRNLPADAEEMIMMAKNLQGLTSNQTALEALPSTIVDDAKYEQERIDKEGPKAPPLV